MMNLFIDSNNQIYSGDRQGDDRELTEEEVNTYVSQQERETTLISLKSQIEELDKKRIRAMAEPEIKDIQSGQTWLEFYTVQIQALRDQIATL